MITSYKYYKQIADSNTNIKQHKWGLKIDKLQNLERNYNCSIITTIPKRFTFQIHNSSEDIAGTDNSN